MNPRPTTAVNPDLDWSQIRETVLMLNLAVAQLKKSMSEGDDSVEVLAESMTYVMEQMNAVQEEISALPELEQKASIVEKGRKMSGKLHSIIVAFQFYDRMTQRLTHLSESLSSLADLIGDPQRLYSPSEWSELQQMIKSSFTIEKDRRMFEALLSGLSVAEALQINVDTEAQDKTQDNGDCVELF